jgi:Ca2+-binding EF-hand superfamily protein
VFVAEIQAALAENSLLESNRVFVDIMDEPKELFNLVDVDHDGRLGPRELAGVRERLLLLDGNHSGELEPEEFPSLLRITFLRGQPFNNRRVGRAFARLETAPVPPAKSWFSDMDVNGDRDLSVREFLGTAEQFHALDADHDGLLSGAEAEYAKILLAP